VPRAERERLSEFTFSIYEFLGAVIASSQWVPEELQEDYRRSLTSGAERGLGDLRLRLLAEDADDEREAIAALDQRLDSAGLSGADLELKLHGYDRAHAIFVQSPSRRLLKSVLRWANVLLGSLVSALGAGEALKELKEAVEAGVEDREDESP
jgi:hypothetical protein